MVLRKRLMNGKDLSLSYLTTLCPISSYMTPRPPDTTLIRCIRSYAEELEARMVITKPSGGPWGFSSGAGAQGGYEVRRRDWGNDKSTSRQGSEKYWLERTIYTVRIFSRTSQTSKN